MVSRASRRRRSLRSIASFCAEAAPPLPGFDPHSLSIAVELRRCFFTGSRFPTDKASSSLSFSLSSLDVILHYLSLPKTHQPLQKRKRTQKNTMNFSSIPAYLDPSNWQQQVTHQVGSSSSTGVSSQLLPPPLPPPPPPPPPPPHGVGGASSIRPGSMAERARMANIPMPEAALKCPRCESTNTKFCYFNNYSLTQPRHFCKTCRRYWTRGGALRNVPVGGGCRRNKRSKGSSSKSPPVSSDRQQTSGSGNSSSSAIASNNSGGLSPQIPPLGRFMAPLHQQLSDFDIGGFSYGGGLSAAATATGDLSFQLGNTTLAGGTSIGSLLGFDQQWRLQQQPPQFPFLSGLDPFDGGSSSGGEGPGPGPGWQMRPKLPSSSRNVSQMGNSVKMEETPDQVNNAGRQFLGNEQYWSNGSMAWSDLSGFSSSSSTRNPL